MMNDIKSFNKNKNESKKIDRKKLKIIDKWKKYGNNQKKPIYEYVRIRSCLLNMI